MFKKLSENKKFQKYFKGCVIALAVTCVLVIGFFFGNMIGYIIESDIKPTHTVNPKFAVYTTVAETMQVNTEDNSTAIPAKVEATAAPTYTPVVVKPTDVPAPKMSVSQKQALLSAKSYLAFASFSRSGLIKQLEFEGFSKEDATYGVDACGADWMKQAALSAKNYLDFTSFSRSGLIKQLQFEGFTLEQATYGVNSTGL